MKMKLKETALKFSTPLVIVGALFLASCGGGGGDAPPAMSDAEKKAAMERTEAANAINAAKAAADALTATSDAAAVTNVANLIATAKEEIADLPAASRAAELAKLSGAENIVATQRERLRLAAEDADREGKAAEAEKKLRNANAKKLFGYLGGTGAHVTSADGVGGSRYTATEAAKAVAGTFMNYNTKEFMDKNATGQVIHVLQYDNKGPGKQVPLTADVTADNFVAKSIKASVFSSNAPKKHATTENLFSTRGTYNGASGQYRCSVTGSDQSCVSRAAAGGGIQLGGGGTWVFDPDPGAMQAMPDANYATFGWWLDEAAESDAKKARSFSHVTPTTALTGVDGVTGSATYNGIAVGKASVYSPVGNNNVSGAFTADAELKATFGSNGKLGGSITGFVVGGQAQNWSVKLNDQSFSGAGVTNGTGDATKTVWTIGGEKATASGSWSATMYDKGADVGGLAAQPKGVTGGFNSDYGSVGRMVGAFGAEKD